jgi:Zn(II)-responsive transcriptional regulator
MQHSAGKAEKAGFGIGELARRAGVGIDTVRYYERSGLVAPHSRLPSGYRRYQDPDVLRLRFIRRAQALGFTLAEIKSLLAISGERSVAQVKRAASAKLEDVERRIRELEQIREALASLLDQCPGHGRAADCPILRALGAEEIS